MSVKKWVSEFFLVSEQIVFEKKRYNGVGVHFHTKETCLLRMPHCGVFCLEKNGPFQCFFSQNWFISVFFLTKLVPPRVYICHILVPNTLLIFHMVPYWVFFHQKCCMFFQNICPTTGIFLSTVSAKVFPSRICFWEKSAYLRVCLLAKHFSGYVLVCVSFVLKCCPLPAPPPPGAEDRRCTLFLMKDLPASWDTSGWDRNISPYGIARLIYINM